VINPGTYTVTVTSANGCSDSESIVITQDVNVPMAVINAPATTELNCTVENILLTATGGGSYSWSDGTNVLGTEATLNVIDPGTYTVTITSANGCSDSESIEITQDVNVPAAGINAPATTGLNCTVENILLTATGGGDYSWSDGINVLGTESTMNVINPGTYTVTVTSANGCSDSESIVITQDVNVPLAGINAPATTELNCSVENILLTATGGGDYSWSDGINVLGTEATLNVINPGTYTVTVTSANGCSDSESIVITQDVNVPLAGINAPATTELNCTVENILLTATGGGSYTWSDGINVLGTESTLNVINPGTYTVTVTSANGCSDSESIVITQDVNVPVAGINAPATTELNCTVENILLTATGGGNYSWSDGTNVLGTEATLNVLNPGTYTVTVTSANGCSDSESIVITQDVNVPVAGINTPATTELNCTVENILLTATGGGSYSWSDGINVLGTEATLNVLNPGTYTVTVTSANACSDSESIVITRGNTGCEEQYCTVTQFTLGISTGSFCDGTSSYNLMDSLLQANGSLIVGIPANNRSFTVPVDEGAQCIIDRFPSYNNAFALSGNLGCGNFGNLLQPDGRFNNTLLVEAITLQFNLWLSPALGNLLLESPEFYIRSSSSCQDENAYPLDDSTHFSIHPSVYTYLGNDPSVQDLMDLANLALGSASLPGSNHPTLGNIKYALKAINEAFENCGFVYFIDSPVNKIELVKTGTYIDNQPVGVYNAGDQIAYSFTVSNVGNLTLANVSINDPMVSVTGSPIAVLEPGASDMTNFSAVYTLTQADIDAGSLTNTATVVGYAGTGAWYDSDSDTRVFEVNPGISLSVTGDYLDLPPSGIFNAGDQISYHYQITNTGNVTLNNVAVNAPMVPLSGSLIPVLAPGAADNSTFTSLYTITQDDVEAGYFTNIASVTGFYQSAAYSATDAFAYSPDKNMLTLKVMIEGLYNGPGSMRQSRDENGPHFENGIADVITLEFHDANDYGTVHYVTGPVKLRTDGYATVPVPLSVNMPCYVTVKHRNSLSTTTESPVISGPSVNCAMDKPQLVYGNNLKLMITGEYVIYSGDVNQDGAIDTADLTPVDNDASGYLEGYLVTDVNGDGVTDTADMTIIDNNSNDYIQTAHP
jgi:hypothetical protein